jgi:membrane peptidoglycan carboxypeptidase
MYSIQQSTVEAREMAALSADACLRLNRAVAALGDKSRGAETLNLGAAYREADTKMRSTQPIDPRWKIYRDAWTFGYTPFLVTGIWAGNNDNTPMQRRGSSILAAVPIWNSFMVEAVKKYKPEKFNDPDPVTASKPMLDGNYLVNGNIHSILYYVDKNDPTGPVPQNPQNDPQFTNWETGVNGWIGTNKSSLLNSFIQQLQGIQNQLFSSSTTSTIR